MRPLGAGLGNVYFFCNVYIGYMLPTFGEQMSVDFVHFPRAQLSGQLFPVKMKDIITI